jgi:3-oxo-4,17-pregnadiene-20-carboxyl-CoA hydratase beta subunit
MSTRRLTEVAVDQELPELVIPITTTLVIGGAIASRDFQDVHHDRDLAQTAGAKDVFMNILTTNGLVGRYATDWAGPDALLRKISIRLGAPNYPSDTMRMTGRVASVDGTKVRLEVRGANSLGDHVSGTVDLELPE